MNATTPSAVAAVAVAAVALFVALAQVLQQYFVTGPLLRLCNNTVYGKLPGRGRRGWKSNQFSDPSHLYASSDSAGAVFLAK